MASEYVLPPIPDLWPSFQHHNTSTKTISCPPCPCPCLCPPPICHTPPLSVLNSSDPVFCYFVYILPILSSPHSHLLPLFTLPTHFTSTSCLTLVLHSVTVSRYSLLASLSLPSFLLCISRPSSSCTAFNFSRHLCMPAPHPVQPKSASFTLRLSSLFLTHPRPAPPRPALHHLHLTNMEWEPRRENTRGVIMHTPILLHL